MMEFLAEAGIVEYAITLFLAFVAYVFKKILPVIIDALYAAADESDNAALSWIAEEAAELMEERHKDLSGHDKFEEGVAWLSERLQNQGLDMDDEKIRAALQSGYNNAVKPQKEAK